MLIKNNKLDWSLRIFLNLKKERNEIGFNIQAIYRFAGRVISIDGLCLSKRGKYNGLVCTSLVLRRKVGTCFLYTRFFIFIGSAFRYKIVGFSYKKKKINFSRISYARYG